ncbi:MAG: TolC family protein [Alphaproteobacteria bacterium]|nr:TolC family protein [Alphaproteobacteria bacterium]
MKMLKNFYIIALSMFCFACNVGEKYKQPNFYDDNKIAAELHLKPTNHLPNNWYLQLKDEQLNQLIQQGLCSSTSVMVALSRLKQARQNLLINITSFLPQINAQGGYNYNKSSKKISASVNSNYYTAGFDASWEIDIWGKSLRQYETDEAKVNAANLSLINAHNLLAADIALNYVKLQQNIRNLELLQKNLFLQKEIFSTVKYKYDNGLIDEISYRQAEYLLADTQAQIPQYESNIEAYRNSLATLVGILPSAVQISSTSLFKGNYIHNSSKIYDLPANVIRQRPDVQIAEQNLIAQNAQVAKAIANLYPDVNISGFWGYAAKNGSGLFNSESQTYNYAPLINMPILDWNRLQNNVLLQKYIKEENLAQYKQVLLNAVSELKNSMTAYENSLKSQKKQFVATANIEKATYLSRSKFENGLIEFSDLLTMQQNLIKAQRDSVNATAAVWQNLIAYYKASGATIDSCILQTESCQKVSEAYK